MGWGGQRHAPAALPPGKNRYPLYKRLGGPQGWCGRVRKISPPPGFDPGRPARSEVIHRLRYPGSGMRVPGENLPHCHFVDHEPHGDWPGIEPGILQWDASSCHHSLGQALTLLYFTASLTLILNKDV